MFLTRSNKYLRDLIRNLCREIYNPGDINALDKLFHIYIIAVELHNQNRLYEVKCMLNDLGSIGNNFFALIFERFSDSEANLDTILNTFPNSPRLVRLIINVRRHLLKLIYGRDNTQEYEIKYINMFIGYVKKYHPDLYEKFYSPQLVIPGLLKLNRNSFRKIRVLKSRKAWKQIPGANRSTRAPENVFTEAEVLDLYIELNILYCRQGRGCAAGHYIFEIIHLDRLNVHRYAMEALNAIKARQEMTMVTFGKDCYKFTFKNNKQPNKKE